VCWLQLMMCRRCPAMSAAIWHTVVLPVPVSPTSRAGSLLRRQRCRREYLQQRFKDGVSALPLHLTCLPQSQPSLHLSGLQRAASQCVHLVQGTGPKRHQRQSGNPHMRCIDGVQTMPLRASRRGPVSTKPSVLGATPLVADVAASRAARICRSRTSPSREYTTFMSSCRWIRGHGSQRKARSNCLA
jgi:hypothetical protein